MRSRSLSTLLFAVLGLALVVFGAQRVARFVHIFSAHAGPPLTQEEVELDFNSTRNTGAKPERIPRIIHQVFHNWKDPGNETIPSDWDAVRATVVTKNPDFEYRLWNESASLKFIATEYPWFLNTYRRYPFPVQRIDALRYFLMLHYGGIYIDLDNGCSRDLEPLLVYPAWVTDGGQGALSNNILAARPNHPYWKMMTDSLIPWSYNYLFPYFTISYASGQWFETAIWDKYHAQLPGEGAEDDKIYRIMMDMREGAPRWVFFTQGRGGSWDNWDNHLFGFIGNVLIPWIGQHVVLLALVFAVLAGWLWYGRRRKRTVGYERLRAGAV